MDELIHRSQQRVLYGDTDAAAVVYNANYLRYFELGRTEFMRDRICTYRDIEQLGFVLPVTECHIRFKAPGRYDDLLSIETTLTALKKFSCTFSYRIMRPEEGTRQLLLAKGFTTHASVNRDGKLAPLPATISQKLRPFLISASSS